MESEFRESCNNVATGRQQKHVAHALPCYFIGILIYYLDLQKTIECHPTQSSIYTSLICLFFIHIPKSPQNFSTDVAK